MWAAWPPLGCPIARQHWPHQVGPRPGSCTHTHVQWYALTYAVSIIPAGLHNQVGEFSGLTGSLMTGMTCQEHTQDIVSYLRQETDAAEKAAARPSNQSSQRSSPSRSQKRLSGDEAAVSNPVSQPRAMSSKQVRQVLSCLSIGQGCCTTLEYDPCGPVSVFVALPTKYGVRASNTLAHDGFNLPGRTRYMIRPCTLEFCLLRQQSM